MASILYYDMCGKRFNWLSKSANPKCSFSGFHMKINDRFV